MVINSYWTYNTLLTPGHSDIEFLTECICMVITDTKRIVVNPQTVNVLDITVQEAQALVALDMPTPDGSNVLRTTLYTEGEPASQFY